jgi:hypothetical protein
MSTITKLDPEHRMRRYQRKASLQSLARVVHLNLRAGRTGDAARASITLASLREIHNHSGMSGNLKDVLFQLAMNTGEAA